MLSDAPLLQDLLLKLGDAITDAGDPFCGP
jgi:hypothetical protein